MSKPFPTAFKLMMYLVHTMAAKMQIRITGYTS